MKLWSDSQGALTPAATSASAHMAASIIELLAQDADVGAVFAAQGIDVAKLAEALRALAKSPPVRRSLEVTARPSRRQTRRRRREIRTRVPEEAFVNGYNFTERVRKVLAMAREEAARLHHEYVGTEHILLGLASRSSKASPPARPESFGVELDDMSRKIEETVKKGESRHDAAH